MSDKTVVLGTVFTGDHSSLLKSIADISKAFGSLIKTVEKASGTLKKDSKGFTDLAAGTDKAASAMKKGKTAASGMASSITSLTSALDKGNISTKQANTLYTQFAAKSGALSGSLRATAKAAATLATSISSISNFTNAIKNAGAAAKTTSGTYSNWAVAAKTAAQQIAASTSAVSNFTNVTRNSGVVTTKTSGTYSNWAIAAKTAAQQIAASTSAVSNFTNVTRNSVAAVQNATSTYNNWAISAQNAAQQVAASTSAISNFSTAAKASGVTVHATDGIYKNWATTAKTAATKTITMSQAVKELGLTAGKTKTPLNAMTAGVTRLKAAFVTLANYMIAGKAIMMFVQSIKGSIVEIAQFDQALRNLKAITGATDGQLQVMSATLMHLAQNTKFSTKELAEGMVLLGQAGFSASESIAAIEAVSTLASATLSELSTTSQLLTTSIRAYGLEAVEAGRVSDVMANAINKSKLTIEKLNTAFNYVGVTAAQAGLSIEETAATMMVLANNGLRASTIGTGLRQVLGRLIAPNKKLQMAFKEQGISLSKVNPAVVGYQNSLKALSAVLWNTETKTVDMAGAFRLFGLRGAQAAAVVVKAFMGGSFSTAIKKVNEVGTAQKMAAEQAKGLQYKFKNLQDTIKTFAISLGDTGLLGVFKKIVDMLKGAFSSAISFMNTEFGSAIVTIGGTTLALNLLTTAFVKLGIVPFLATMTLWISQLGALVIAEGAATVATGLLADAFHALKLLLYRFWPVALIAAVVSVGVAIYKLSTYTERHIETLKKEKAELDASINKYDAYIGALENLSKAQKRGENVSERYASVIARMLHEFPNLKKEVDLSTASVDDLAAAMKKLRGKEQEKSINTLVSLYKEQSQSLQALKNHQDLYNGSMEDGTDISKKIKEGENERANTIGELTNSLLAMGREQGLVGKALADYVAKQIVAKNMGVSYLEVKKKILAMFEAEADRLKEATEARNTYIEKIIENTEKETENLSVVSKAQDDALFKYKQYMSQQNALLAEHKITTDEYRSSQLQAEKTFWEEYLAGAQAHYDAIVNMEGTTEKELLAARKEISQAKKELQKIENEDAMIGYKTRLEQLDAALAQELVTQQEYNERRFDLEKKRIEREQEANQDAIDQMVADQNTANSEYEKLLVAKAKLAQKAQENIDQYFKDSLKEEKKLLAERLAAFKLVEEEIKTAYAEERISYEEMMALKATARLASNEAQIAAIRSMLPMLKTVYGEESKEYKAKELEIQQIKQDSINTIKAMREADLVDLQASLQDEIDAIKIKLQVHGTSAARIKELNQQLVDAEGRLAAAVTATADAHVEAATRIESFFTKLKEGVQSAEKTYLKTFENLVKIVDDSFKTQIQIIVDATKREVEAAKKIGTDIAPIYESAEKDITAIVESYLNLRMAAITQSANKRKEIARKLGEDVKGIEAEISKVRLDAYKKAEAAYKSMISKMISEEQKLLDKIKEIHAYRSGLSEDLATKEHDIDRGLMDSKTQYYDSMGQAQKALSSLRKAAHDGDLEGIKKYTTAAVGFVDQMQDEVVTRTTKGDERVLISKQKSANDQKRLLRSIYAVAERGSAKAEKAAQKEADGLSKSIANAEQKVKDLDKAINAIQTKADNAIEFKFKAETKDLDDKLGEYTNAEQDKYKIALLLEINDGDIDKTIAEYQAKYEDDPSKAVQLPVDATFALYDEKMGQIKESAASVENAITYFVKPDGTLFATNMTEIAAPYATDEKALQYKVNPDGESFDTAMEAIKAPYATDSEKAVKAQVVLSDAASTAFTNEINTLKTTAENPPVSLAVKAEVGDAQADIDTLKVDTESTHTVNPNAAEILGTIKEIQAATTSTHSIKANAGEATTLIAELKKPTQSTHTVHIEASPKNFFTEVKKPTSSTHTINVNASAVLNMIAKIKKPTHSTHTIHVKTVRSGSSSSKTSTKKKRTGGVIEQAAIRAREGAYIPREGQLDGYGGGDRIKALLEAGEFVVRKEAVAKYGTAMLTRVNNMKAAPDAKMATGGAVYIKNGHRVDKDGNTLYRNKEGSFTKEKIEDNWGLAWTTGNEQTKIVYKELLKLLHHNLSAMNFDKITGVVDHFVTNPSEATETVIQELATYLAKGRMHAQGSWVHDFFKDASLKFMEGVRGKDTSDSSSQKATSSSTAARVPTTGAASSASDNQMSNGYDTQAVGDSRVVKTYSVRDASQVHTPTKYTIPGAAMSSASQQLRSGTAANTSGWKEGDRMPSNYYKKPLGLGNGWYFHPEQNTWTRTKSKYMNKGGWVPGTGNSDTVDAKLTPGEIVIPKDVITSGKIDEFLQKLNVNFKVPSLSVPNFKSSVQHFKDGGIAQKVVDTVNLNFNVGKQQFPLQGERGVVNTLIDALRQETLVAQ